MNQTDKKPHDPPLRETAEAQVATQRWPEPGTGTRVTVWLPIDPAAAANGPRAVPPAPTP